MLTQAVAVYFRELREGRGYTQESLATAVDVSKRTVERLERSEGDISSRSNHLSASLPSSVHRLKK
jgi:DNA-binding XRE family transcriptional regulator